MENFKLCPGHVCVCGSKDYHYVHSAIFPTLFPQDTQNERGETRFYDLQ